MKTVIGILESLEETQGSLAKREILEVNRNNALLKSVFVAAGDPHTVYYVNKFKPSIYAMSQFVNSDDVTLNRFVNVTLNKLSSRELTGNAAKSMLEFEFSTMTKLQQKWCLRILIKNMRCGIQSTVNKVWPGAIKSFEVATAGRVESLFIEGKGIMIETNVKYPVRVEPKFDGLRLIAIKSGGVVTMFTRNGSILETLPRIKNELESASYDNVVLDGEALGADWAESNSVLMSKKTFKNDDNIKYNVFDAVPLEQWIAQKSTEMYYQRLALVKNIVDSLSSTGHVKTVPHIDAKNETELLTYYKKCMSDGFEGVMLKTLDSYYKFKRSDNILKLKPVVTYEGTIVDHYNARNGTKREGLWGGFEILLPNGVITRLGGGFSDALKAQIQLTGPENFIGQIVELEAQPEPLTHDGLTEDGRARFPVFIRFRDESDVDQSVIKAYENWCLEKWV